MKITVTFDVPNALAETIQRMSKELGTSYNPLEGGELRLDTDTNMAAFSNVRALLEIQREKDLYYSKLLN